MLLSAETSVLLLVDLQRKLMPAVHEGDAVVAAAARLVEAAELVDVPVVATEQYPDGLGPTVPPLAGRAGRTLAKTAFSALAAPGGDTLLPPDRPQVVLAGAEAHVCVLQTALQLREAGAWPVLVADAVGSRAPADRDAALDRARAHGVEVVTSEMVLFEWVRGADHPAFRPIQKLLR